MSRLATGDVRTLLLEGKGLYNVLYQKEKRMLLLTDQFGMMLMQILLQSLKLMMTAIVM